MLNYEELKKETYNDSQEFIDCIYFALFHSQLMYFRSIELPIRQGNKPSKDECILMLKEYFENEISVLNDVLSDSNFDSYDNKKIKDTIQIYILSIYSSFILKLNIYLGFSTRTFKAEEIFSFDNYYATAAKSIDNLHIEHLGSKRLSFRWLTNLAQDACLENLNHIKTPLKPSDFAPQADTDTIEPERIETKTAAAKENKPLTLDEIKAMSNV